MIASCGIDCSKCEAYLATKEDSDAGRIETAQKWSEMYGSEIKPEQINCAGCRAEGLHFAHCSKCEIRKCCISRSIATCADCSDYKCDKLTSFFEMVPEAAQHLEQLRKN